MKKLYRSPTNRQFCGVCAGIAEYFDMDPTLVRALWVVLSLVGPGLIAYILLACIIPESPDQF